MAPSHFVAVQLRSKTLLRNLHDFVELELKKRLDSDLRRCLTQVKKSHVSLFVVDLKNEKGEESAVKVFNSVLEKRHKGKKIRLHFNGVGELNIRRGQKILFVSVKVENEEKSLNEIVDDLKTEFAKLEGVKVPEEKAIPLHLSLLNTNIENRKRKSLDIEEDLLKEFTEKDFGFEDVVSIQLLARNKGFDSEGYYRCEAEVML